MHKKHICLKSSQVSHDDCPKLFFTYQNKCFSKAIMVFSWMLQEEKEKDPRKMPWFFGVASTTTSAHICLQMVSLLESEGSALPILSACNLRF